MRISQHYQLGRSQPTLDFVDVDAVGDVRVFISPRALRLLRSRWADECVSLLHDFFSTVLELIRTGDGRRAEQLLGMLREPNETHLGLSKGKARGRALGTESTHDVWQALRDSEAVRSGLLEDLEDTILMIEGISTDIISDITTNVIRGPLIEYTQNMCELHGIPTEEVDSGPLWDPGEKAWHSMYVRLPTIEGRRLMLVPKGIVRKRMDYDPDEYFRHYILEALRAEELNANSGLVQLLKKGGRRVTKKSLIEKYGKGKAAIVRETLRRPDVLEQYRRSKRGISNPLTHEDFAEVEGTGEPNWQALLAAVCDLPTGRDDAADYEKRVEALLSALFYPFLSLWKVQHQIHQGRKRIDITYANMSQAGFFGWLASHYPSAHIFVECKNYGGEVGNPELDQLSGRFSPSRGKAGLLVCRNFDDKDRFILRCRDTALDDRGFVIPIDDDDLAELVRSRVEGDQFGELPLLAARFRQMI